MNLRKRVRNFFTLTHGRDDGFTLVELIVVIAILAILGGVGVPAYSGYVQKADRAADEALLNEINTAFASACMINGENNYYRTDVNASIESDKKFAYEAPFIDDFNGFFEGEDIEFKVFEALIYNAKAGGFAETTQALGELYRKLADEYGNEIALYAMSNLGSLGSQRVMQEIADLASWAQDESIAAMGGENFLKACWSYMGLEGDYDESKLADAMSKLEDPEAFTANAIALYAAQNSADLQMSSISAWLDDDVEDLLASPNATTLSEAAAIYGLYMSYTDGNVYKEGESGAFAALNNAMGDDEFAEWLQTDAGQSELNAYKAAMSIIDGAAESGSADSILNNGFDDPELIKLMESLIGN